MHDGCCGLTATQIFTVPVCILEKVADPSFSIFQHREKFPWLNFWGLDVKNTVLWFIDRQSWETEAHHLTLWPVNASKESGGIWTQMSHILCLPLFLSEEMDSTSPQCNYSRKSIYFFEECGQSVWLKHSAQSIPLTQDPFFTVRWDNSQTASELTNVTA